MLSLAPLSRTPWHVSNPPGSLYPSTCTSAGKTSTSNDAFQPTCRMHFQLSTDRSRAGYEVLHPVVSVMPIVLLLAQCEVCRFFVCRGQWGRCFRARSPPVARSPPRPAGNLHPTAHLCMPSVLADAWRSASRRVCNAESGRMRSYLRATGKAMLRPAFAGRGRPACA
jgi:hypothetical protein